MKVVDLEKLWNFIVDNFLICILLGPQTTNLDSVQYNMLGKKIEYRHEWECGAVVEEITREGEVAGSNPAGRVVHEYRAKNAATWVESRSDISRARSSDMINVLFCAYFMCLSYSSHSRS